MEEATIKQPAKLGHAIEDLSFAVKENTRFMGYNNNLPVIELLKILGIWNELKHDSSRKYFHTINNIFKIPRTNLYNWQKNLQFNEDWVPDHQKQSPTSRVFTPEQFTKLSTLIQKIADSKNISIKNKMITAITNLTYQTLIFHPQPNLKFNSSEHYILKLKDQLNN